MDSLEQKYLDSREVAEMVGKEHNMLLRDIRRYAEQLGQSKIAQSDFFKESTYKNKQNKEQPCYLVTKKGCEFIAHKLTGVKGTEFTAKIPLSLFVSIILSPLFRRCNLCSNF